MMEPRSKLEIGTSAAVEEILPAPAAASEYEPAPHLSRLAGGSEGMHWYALRTKPRHEKVVSRNLSAKGYECFLPCWKKIARYGRRRAEWELALFPGYVFCRFDPLRRLPVLTTPGVWGVVGAGRQPIPADETELSSLRVALRAGALARPLPFLEPGQPVRIAGGPLAGVEGIVVNSRNPMRVVVSISLLQRSVLLEIDWACVGRERTVAPAPLEAVYQPRGLYV